MSRPEETIAALATPPGTSALAVVRISGPNTQRLAAALATRPLTPRAATHVDYRDRNGQLLDDVLLTFFQGPRSYTGEDALEISTHGNPFIAQKVLEDLYARGCVPAEPGEFTQRAFLNGRMDLSQAEAVMDVIHARSERALAAANAHLRGALGQKLETLIVGVLGVLAQLEAYIDFPDEDLPPENRAENLAAINSILLSCRGLCATSRYGEMLREGIKTVILGLPNAGKSSLLNALVGRERALVSPEPGTTRDFIEERIVVGAHSLRLIDTAGLNQTPGAIEKLGIEKTYERAAEADLFLLVIDSSSPDRLPLPPAVRARLTPENTLLVLNKSDLAPTAGVADEFGAQFSVLHVSATTGAGMEALRDAITRLADCNAGSLPDGVSIAINARHAHALSTAQAALQDAAEKLEAGEPVELVCSDLRGALAAFGEITGRIDNERMLDQLFASFCIGK